MADDERNFGIDAETLGEVVVGLLRARGMTLSTAESCTGGMVSVLVTDIPGSSEVYVGGAVTYSDALKTRLLDVSEDLLAEHGAVSEACARAMAEGARACFGTDLAISITGIAGPGGGSTDKPVGTVHFALATPASTLHKLQRLPPPRDTVRRAAAWTALNMVRSWLRDSTVREILDD